MNSPITFLHPLHRRTGATRSDVIMSILAIAAILLIGSILLLPHFGSRGPSLRNSCQNNLRQVGLALHTFADARKRLPAAYFGGPELDSAPPLTHQIAASTDPASQARYSWIVQILPYMEEQNIYNQVTASSEKFQRMAFDPANMNQKGHQALPTIQIDILRCPSAEDDGYSTAPEYKRFVQVRQMDGKTVGIATSSYAAFAATELDLVADRAQDANGVIVPRGITFADIKGGTSRTIVAAETKETAYSCWYDAGGTWLVAIPPAEAHTRAELDAIPRVRRENLHVINYGPDAYLPKTAWPNQQPRRWGPSSSHTGGIVVHAFADSSVRSIHEDIDAKVYRALIDRNATDAEKGAAISHLDQ